MKNIAAKEGGGVRSRSFGTLCGPLGHSNRTRGTVWHILGCKESMAIKYLIYSIPFQEIPPNHYLQAALVKLKLDS